MRRAISAPAGPLSLAVFLVPLLGAAFALVLGVACCSPFSTQGAAPPIRVLSWNVLSLFDAVDDGGEYREFSVEGGTWSEALYRRRLELVASVLLSVEPPAGKGRPGPEVACLLEIENEGILAELAEGPLKAAGYAHRAFARAPGSSIGLGLLSRLPIREARAWGLALGGREERPLLEARLEGPAGPLLALVCHWKSKLEGAEATEGKRREAARLLSDLVTARQGAEPALAILACGDFNENPDEFARTGGRYPSALFPAGPGRPAGEGGLALGDREAVLGADPPGSVLESAWSGSDAYSYVHNGTRERIDGFLLGPGLVDGLGLEFRSFSALDGGGLVDSAGRPRAWSSAKASGWSDHLPIMVELADRGGAAK